MAPTFAAGSWVDPNLLRSLVVLNDQQGELILPIVRGSRAERGMPPMPLSDDDVRAVAEYIHSVLATSGRQGMPPPSDAPPPDIVDRRRPRRDRPTSPRSAAPATRRPGTCRASPPASRNRRPCSWRGCRAARSPAAAGAARRRSAQVRKPVTVTVTAAVGREGERPPGAGRSLHRHPGARRRHAAQLPAERRPPKVEIQDPNVAHKKLLAVLHRERHPRPDRLSGDVEMTSRQTAADRPVPARVRRPARAGPRRRPRRAAQAARRLVADLFGRLHRASATARSSRSTRRP